MHVKIYQIARESGVAVARGLEVSIELIERPEVGCVRRLQRRACAGYYCTTKLRY